MNDQVTFSTNHQLRDEIARGAVFKGFLEGPLNFFPTYKYDVGTDKYDTTDKMRIPSWCDRILYKAKDTRMLGYATVGLRYSDHRPGKFVFYLRTSFCYFYFKGSLNF